MRFTEITQKLAGAFDMMRYQRVNPDILPLHSSGRKANSHDAAGYPSSSSIRVRPGSGSGFANPIQTHQETSSGSHFPPSSVPLPSEAQHQVSNGRDVLLQWGHKKGPRGPRAENRTTGDESTSHPARQMVKIQRRAAIAGAEKIAAAAAAAAMPPPYTRASTLRPSSSVIDHRTVEDGSGGQTRSDKKRSLPSPAEKCHSKPVAVVRNGFGPDCHDAKAGSDQHESASGSGKEKVSMEQFEWPRIFVSLSRKEKEDDFLAMKGTKLPQRPKKRAKNIDKTLQYCFPGMWLSDLTRGRYEVREKKCVKKKPRGLKGMESMESDSE